MVTRQQLLADPRSGARPLPGSPGPGEDDDDATAPLPAAPRRQSNTHSSPRRDRATPARTGVRSASGNARSASRTRARYGRGPGSMSGTAPGADGGMGPAAAAALAMPGEDQADEGQAEEQAPEREARGFRPGPALGGVVVGLFLWGFAENWIRGGKPQATQWLRAKFLNQVS